MVIVIPLYSVYLSMTSELFQTLVPIYVYASSIMVMSYDIIASQDKNRMPRRSYYHQTCVFYLYQFYFSTLVGPVDCSDAAYKLKNKS
jgi:hypothetical protein